MLTLYFVRHGEVHNPTGIIYGQLPGFGLSATGRQQIENAASILAEAGPFQALYASPLQRAQESAAILADGLALSIETDKRIIETGIGGYQGKIFADLPQPYITEEATHEGLESAASIRARILEWVEEVQPKYADQKIIAVSHRDPIIVALLHWMGEDLQALPTFDLLTGGVYKICLEGKKGQVDRIV